MNKLTAVMINNYRLYNRNRISIACIPVLKLKFSSSETWKNFNKMNSVNRIQNGGLYAAVLSRLFAIVAGRIEWFEIWW